MHSQKKFDEIVSNKMDSQEFPFDEANWETGIKEPPVTHNLPLLSIFRSFDATF